jgi:hypothetical protein
MSLQIDRNNVPTSEFVAEMTASQLEAAWDESFDIELESRISKENPGNSSGGNNYC